MTDTIPQPPRDYAVGRAQKDIRDVAVSACVVDYVDHTNWGRVPDPKPGGYGFVYACIGVVVAITVVPMALGWMLS